LKKIGIFALIGAALVASATGRLLAQAEAKEPATVHVRVDTSGPTTRLILSHSRPVVYAVQASEGFVELVYAEPVVAEPRSDRIGDAILKGYDMQDDRTLLFLTGPGYTNYESFELRNPFRIVLDLKGKRPGGATLPNTPRTRDAWRKVIVIEPGHGGSEAGAIGPSGLEEKEVTLDLARRLKQELQQDTDISVVLTRDEDVRLDLDERTAVANHNRADLFISIHLNGSGRKNASGAETYYMSSDATDNEARTLAALENKNFGVDPGALNGAAKDDGLELVLWDLAQNQYLTESSALAERIQRHLNELTDTRDRGVRQAQFRVLMGATMPAVLVEVGFISNAEEEMRFRGLSYRRQVVQAIAEAVHEFLGDLNKLAPADAVGAVSGGGAPRP